MTQKTIRCRFCSEQINQDIVALNKKIIDRNIPKDKCVCLNCMAETLECSIEDLQDKIEQFKEEGCVLFG